MTKNGVDLKSLMQVRIFPAALHHCKNDMTFFIGFAMQTLEKMENEESRDGEKGPPKVRVFVHALQAIASEGQWSAWHDVVHKNLSKAKYVQVAKEIGLEPIEFTIVEEA